MLCALARRLSCICAIAVLQAAGALFAVAGEANQLSESERLSGWKLLFDGKTTEGWRNYRKESLGDGWKVENEALTRVAAGAGDIVTQKQYENFELLLDYKISPRGNSGIMFHVTEDAAAPWHSGPEIQVQDNVEGRDPQKAGWLYQLYQPTLDPSTGKPVDATRPAGEWNQLHLRVTAGECEINMNGVRYAVFRKGSADWDARVAKSKFSQYPQFGKPKQGFICLQDHGDPVAYRNIKIRELSGEGEPPNPIHDMLPFQPQLAFPELQWEGWEPVDERGRPEPFRPIILTHANDGTNRLFVANQWGDIYVFANDPQVKQSKRFINLRDRVRYQDKQNEEGLLGMAFHPQYKKNGQFFIYYTTQDAPHTSVISRFKVSSEDPQRADPDSEEEILRIPQPFWNHNGGTIAFGPDGYLYIGLGDGGAANDPHRNGQNLETWLGSLLRIDVDHIPEGKKYGIPQDNPFVQQKGAQPEIFAYGFRNIWRFAFDRQTGACWCADVGQNLWEEINLVEKGGNYGWNFREGTHPFGGQSPPEGSELIAPIWEYDHGVGKSITGGVVYRGQALPELTGKYLYADYVTGRLWALTYDSEQKRVVSNQGIASAPLPVISFGEDAQGEVYFSVVSPDGRGIYKFAKRSGH